MRIRSLICCSLVLFAGTALAQNTTRWIMISGTVGVFHTDARIFNPSFEKDIQVTARFYPAGAPPVFNGEVAAGPGTQVTVPKRSMLILNDVTSTLFNTNSLGAIELFSADTFEATSRIYAQASNGTLGQFGPGTALNLTLLKGALLQMKQNGVAGQVGTFRTNIGFVNPVNNDNEIRVRLYDRNNAVVGSGTFTMPAYGVTTPILMNSTFFWDQLDATADLSDAWVSFVATHPVFGYASVVDNGTTDQTFVPAVADAGVEPEPQQPQPTTHTFDVTLQDFSISFSPNPTNIRVGDTVRLRIRRLNGIHGFQVNGPTSVAVPAVAPSGNNVAERSFVVTAAGIYDYFCTVITCGEGHFAMAGSFSAQAQSDPGDDPGRGPGY
ncbi:MAG TPA: hypothetical protein VFT12_02145 [Thermoanaerobaculia bacterium]|nr:hypothetical protein [Thermoanaerobaculia bacterium]